MTAELTWPVLTMVLAASMWIPSIAGVNMHPPAGNPFLRLAHAAGMISGLARMPVRPLPLTLSRACTLALAVEVPRA